MKKKYNINILEQELSVLSDAGDDHVANVVQYVRDKVEQVRGASSNINILNIAILTALNIADEYLKLVVIDEKTCNQLESRTESLISLMDGMK
ncbi:MAG TPA: cell division protein ZapA [Syntrophales bacterium]|nr:cell division protein ZapA [Syntrophales bacterium]